MPTAMQFFILIVIVHALGYGIGLIINKGKLRPDVWFVNYVKGVNVAWKALFGVTPKE
jgi:hypothetical protein